ncbi:unnamed protein product [Kluyveromyces dobzhanskii CBS 2104]|uniref:WGS project CCBQ000000000 data, contig 00012 n=1 Tax=Kluyveromyces dobzhanskii CBS 2104 TaxID=1427455 RepID=A0A0A8L0C2_9SACH|nr:unnamed protein product [Kluyveromyces dobzhanskii CBS 2104]
MNETTLVEKSVKCWSASVGEVSYEKELYRYSFLTHHTLDSCKYCEDLVHDKTLLSNARLPSHRQIPRYTDYVVLESATLRLLSASTQTHALTKDIPQQPDKIEQVYVLKSPQKSESDYLITISDNRNMQLRRYTCAEWSTEMRTSSVFKLDKLEKHMPYIIIGDQCRSGQFMLLCQSPNTLTAASFEIITTNDEPKIIACAKKLSFVRSKLLYATMVQNCGHHVALFAIWNCSRVCIIHIEWSQLNDDRNAYRFVLPNISTVQRITHLNDQIFLISNDKMPFLMSSSQIKTGDWEFKPMPAFFNNITMHQSCDNIIPILQRSNGRLYKFHHSTVVLIENSDILVVLSTKTGEVKYFHLLSLKFAQKIYVTDMTEDCMTLEVISGAGIERVVVPLQVNHLFSLNENFREAEPKRSPARCVPMYLAYGKVSSFIREYVDNNPWCIGKSGLYQVDRSGCQIQHTKTIKIMSIQSPNSQQFIFDLRAPANRGLLRTNSVSLSEYDRSYLILCFESTVNFNIIQFDFDHMSQSKIATTECPFNLENTHTVNVIPFFDCLFQVLPDKVLQLDKMGNKEIVYETERIFTAVAYGFRNEIIVVSRKNENKVTFIALTKENSALVIVKEIDIELTEPTSDDTVKPMWFEGKNVYFSLKSENFVICYTYGIDGELQSRKINHSFQASDISEYGFNESREETGLYTEIPPNFGKFTNVGTKEDLSFSDGASKMIQLSKSCVIIHDNSNIALLENGHLRRVNLDLPRNLIEEENPISNVSAMFESGQLVALMVLLGTHLLIARAKHVSNILMQHRVRERDNNVQCHSYLPQINRMLVYNARKQYVYGVKLQTGKIVSLEFSNVRDFHKIYHLSEVNFQGKCEDRNCYIALVGGTRYGMILLKLCRISFKRGKLYMKQVNELRLGKLTGPIQTAEVTKRCANGSELWVRMGNKLLIATITSTNLSINHDFTFDDEISELELCSNLMLIKTACMDPVCRVGRINEFLNYGTKALVSMRDYQDVDRISEQTLKSRFFEPHWLVIWGNHRLTGQGLIVFIRTTIHGLRHFSSPQTTAASTSAFTLRPHPVDVMQAKARDHIQTWTILHKSGQITTLRTETE